MRPYEFRRDVKFLQSINSTGALAYLVEAPASKDVYVFGEEEKFLCQQMNGINSAAEILEKFRDRFHERLSKEQLEAFIRDLGARGFLDVSAGDVVDWTGKELLPLQETWTRWPLFTADRGLAWIAQKLSWLFTSAFVGMSIAVFILGLCTALFNYRVFFNDLHLLTQSGSLLQATLFFYLFVNIPSEFARAVTSVRFGATSNEVGIWLVHDIIPQVYCHGSWENIPDKAHRTAVVAAPLLTILLFGSMGILLWRMTPPGSGLHGIAFLVGIICMLALLVRLNFLWTSDAYYLLSNHFGVSALRERAKKVAKAWILRRPMPEPLSVHERKAFVGYGVINAVVTIVLVAWLGYLLFGNLVDSLAGTGGFIFITMILIKFRKSIARFFSKDEVNEKVSIATGRSSLRKNLFRASLLILLAIVLALPYPYEAGGPCKLLPLERVELRTQVGGEIKRVMVSENSKVAKGDAQALIDVREHQKNLEVTRADMEKARADLKLLEEGPKPEEVRKAEEQVNTARTHLDYSRKEEQRLKELHREGVIPLEEYEKAARDAEIDFKNLDIAVANLDLVKSGSRQEEVDAQKAVVKSLKEKERYYADNLGLTKLAAPIAGHVVTPYLETKVGQILKEGDLFAVYENSDEIQAEIQVPEADIGQIRTGAEVKVRPYAYPTRFFRGTVTLIAPKAEETQNGRVVRVLTTIPNVNQELKPEMTGEAKIQGEKMPVALAFTRQLVRFIMVEIWSWLP